MKTILVTNENVKAIASNDADKSVFEKYDYDIQIKNDGTLDELQQVATDFVQDLWKKEIKNVYEKPKFVPTMLNGDIVMLNDFFKLELSSQMQRYIKINFKRRFPVQAFAWTLI